MTKDLSAFSLRHFTYINQIFGDQSVRAIISELFPNKMFTFHVKKINRQGDTHHTLLYAGKGKKRKEWCSVNEGYQDMDKNVNDTLCQSYTLVHYLHYTLYPSSKENQMEMIKMYRWLLTKQCFVDAMDEIIHCDNDELWLDYSEEEYDKYLEMDKKDIFNVIKRVLNEWEEYGYQYFIGNKK
jgi:hypothetical protein